MAASERKAARWIAAFVAIVASATACQALVTFAIEVPVVDAGLEAAAVDAPDDAPLLPVDPCGPAPPRPGRSDKSDTVSLVFAAYRWGFDIRDAGDLCDEPGRNIDGIETVKPCDDSAQCKQYQEAFAFSNCDGENGIDNMAREIAHNALFALTGSPFQSASLETSLTRGTMNIIIKLDGYNGSEDDDDVDVTFYASAGMVGGHPSNLGTEQLNALEPVWDGGQDAAWIVDERSVDKGALGPQPKFRGKGYVSRGIFVVETVNLGFGLPIVYSIGDEAFRYGRFIAKLVNEGGRYKMTHGRLTGAISSQTLLGTLGAMRGGLAVGGKLLCDDQRKPEYAPLKPLACNLLDLGFNIDAPDASAPCGYASFGFQMAMVESRLETVDGGEKGYLVTSASGAQARPPCADYEAGTVWCDDCAWDAAQRCDADLPPIDAGADAFDQ